MEGFAKLHTFKFDGSKVYFSGKMIKSSTYKDSVDAGEYVPQINLSKFANPEDEWNIFEMLQIMIKVLIQFFGNASYNAVS